MMDQLAQAWQPLTGLCNTTQNSLGRFTDPCKFNHLILLAKNIITDLVILATLAATVGFIFVGFKLMTSGGNPGALSDAKEMFKKVLFGFLWIIAAWVVVYTITSVLLKPEFNIVIGQPR